MHQRCRAVPCLAFGKGVGFSKRASFWTRTWVAGQFLERRTTMEPGGRCGRGFRSRLCTGPGQITVLFFLQHTVNTCNGRLCQMTKEGDIIYHELCVCGVMLCCESPSCKKKRAMLKISLSGPQRPRAPPFFSSDVTFESRKVAQKRRKQGGAGAGRGNAEMPLIAPGLERLNSPPPPFLRDG
jgi:hypothetical protein